MPDSETPCANPLFLGWVKEWVDLARERNSKGVITYKHAYNALERCPITFSHPSQLQQLRGFGPKLCDRLTDKLEKHCRENGLPMPKRPRQWRIPGLADQMEDEETEELERRAAAKKPRKAKPYVPALRSGAYALVIALSALDENAAVGMTKNRLIEAAQPHCEASFTAPGDATKFYTAWNSMKTLVDKDLVHERGRPTRRYTLTDEGWEVAKRIEQTRNPTLANSAQAERAVPRPQELPIVTVPGPSSAPRAPNARSPSLEVEDQPRPSSSFADVVANGNSASPDSALPNFRPIRLAPGTFTVHLVLDFREVFAKTNRNYMQDELTKKGVKPIMRSLELGDALWVAKCHDANFLSRVGAEGDEVVLDWICERKRLDDLIGSIKDGRFHEQKFRSGRSGVRNVVYIVEDIAMDSTSFDKYSDAVQSAIASTQVVNGYFLKRTQKMDDTIRYLTKMTVLLKKQYESRSLFVIPTHVLTAQNYLPLLAHLRDKDPAAGHYISYPAFASLASKSDTMTLRDQYLKMLMCTKQVTGEKALEIQKRWKTPYEFVKAFEECGGGGDLDGRGGEQDKKRKHELVFGETGNLVGRRKIAKTLSKSIAEVWADVG